MKKTSYSQSPKMLFGNSALMANLVLHHHILPHDQADLLAFLGSRVFVANIPE